MPEIVKVKSLYFQKLAGASECSADGISRVGEYLVFYQWHGLDDRQSLFLQITPDIVADFFAGVLHVPDQHAFAFHVEVFPADADDLFLPSGGEDGKGDDPMHGDGRGATSGAVQKVLHELI